MQNYGLIFANHENMDFQSYTFSNLLSVFDMSKICLVEAFSLCQVQPGSVVGLCNHITQK